jgi:hypothetical protein
MVWGIRDRGSLSPECASERSRALGDAGERSAGLLAGLLARKKWLLLAEVLH